MTINRRTFLATSAAATAAIGTPMILRAQPSEYILGVSLPLTGPFATAGQLVAPVFSLAQKMFNDEGGIAGTPIRFVTEDSGYIPNNTLANYQRALANHGTDMIGYFADSTGAMKLIAPELRGANARIMGSTSFASELANPAENPYQYLSGPTYQSQFDILLQNIKDAGGSKVAFIFSNTEFGRDPIEHGKATAERLGLEVVLEESTKAQGADIPTHVTKLAQSGAEFCILQGYVTGVWPQLIGGARQFGLPVQFKGTFWGMEKFIADRITNEAGPILDGYQGVMPYRYFYDREGAPRYETYAALSKEMFAGTPMENYMSTWALQTMCGLELAVKAFRDTAEAGNELTADNVAETLSAISDWDSGGFFGGPVTMENNAIGTGRVYSYSAETKLFTPTSDWLSV
ncbi:ABC transporter substrate-binding protein [Thalassococcus sp. S3]|uniref:ABC transporter substrate-binding protein n=1 Tax=Thalassococcus sp. S3 TaxID=2017482 RepID=UPI0010242FDF|nr:ABC transporter substrate-binding protein [Thalassococcus sp. S3]QBF33055.1 amino acid ABC transporter substrate-binding protein [Thalassococcus sp. S3]